MFLIVGTKRLRLERPLKTDARCPRCRVRVFFIFRREKRWVTFFFIRVLRYRLVEYVFCPYCRAASELTVEQKRDAREGTLRFDDGEGTPAGLPDVAWQWTRD